jgi:acetyl esterase
MNGPPPTDRPAAPDVDRLPDGPGVTHLDPSDPAAPYYDLLSKLRSPLTLRDLMIEPVRTGYIGQAHRVDPADLPPSAARLYPQVAVSEVRVPSPAGRCAARSSASPARARGR